MRAALGVAGIAVSLSAAILGVAAIAAGLARRSPSLLAAGRRSVAIVLAGAVLSAAAMEWALLSHDFTIAYVAENHARSTPVLYTVASLWGALEGSILLWALVLSGYLAFTVARLRTRASDPLVAWATLVGLVVAIFFFALLLGPANPFRLVDGVVPLDGRGPNPLLQNHPLMAFHPPMLYLGYVGFTVPFCFAVAALVTGRVGEGWLLETRRATLVAWGFLTAGIVLGAWWSYEVLGWGGYWAWDPVENASFLPWLTGTAYLHSVAVQERRGMLRVWNLSLVLSTFCLTILGTFLTRSGIVNSVHSFTTSAIGPLLLGFLALVVVTGVGLIGWRAERLRSPGSIDSPLSREAAFLGNNLLFSAFAFVVLLGTVFPLLAEALSGRRLSVGEPYFDRMTVPIGLALLFLMAVAPVLPWRAASAEVLARRLIVPGWVGAATMATTVLLGARGVAQVATFGLAAFALTGIVRQWVLGVVSRRRSTGEGVFRAAASILASSRRLYGGLVVHAGVVTVAVALAASSGYASRAEVRLAEGETARVGGHSVTYLGSDRRELAGRTTVSVRLEVRRGGRLLGVNEPALSFFANVPQAIGTPSVRTGLLGDVYLTLVSSPDSSGSVTVGVLVNPLVVWLWIGGLVMAFGAVLAAWPGRRSDRGLPRPPAGTSPLREPVRERVTT